MTDISMSPEPERPGLPPATEPELTAIKQRLRATWMAGDYGRFSTWLEPGALAFLDRLDMQPGMRMLDVACGAGQTAIPAAGRGLRVTGVDIATNLLQQARARAREADLEVRFDEGDAEVMAYKDGVFDLVISVIGAMFAPRPQRIASELLRVCRPGGRIAMANWTAEGAVGEMFHIIGKFVPPPAAIPSPLLWGNEDTVRERFGAGVSSLHMARRNWPFRYPFVVANVVEYFREHYGPINRTFAVLDIHGQSELRHALEDLWRRHNRATNGDTHVDAEYLEVVAVRA